MSTIDISNHVITIRGNYFLLKHGFRLNASPKESASHHGMKAGMKSITRRRKQWNSRQRRPLDKFKRVAPPDSSCAIKISNFYENYKFSNLNQCNNTNSMRPFRKYIISKQTNTTCASKIEMQMCDPENVSNSAVLPEQFDDSKKYQWNHEIRRYK